VTYADPDLVYGQVHYERPLGTQGLALQAGVGRTEYALGEEFTALQARGQAQSWNVGLSYPLVLRPRLQVQAQLQHSWRDLQDRLQATGTRTDKRARRMRLSVSAQVHDGLG